MAAILWGPGGLPPRFLVVGFQCARTPVFSAMPLYMACNPWYQFCRQWLKLCMHADFCKLTLNINVDFISLFAWLYKLHRNVWQWVNGCRVPLRPPGEYTKGKGRKDDWSRERGGLWTPKNYDRSPSNAFQMLTTWLEKKLASRVEQRCDFNVINASCLHAGMINYF